MNALPMSGSSGALVPYHSTPVSTTTTSTTGYASGSSSLISARYFTAQTGQAIATELLHRLLWDIFNRLLASLHRFASRQFDSLSSFLERKYAERQQAIEAARSATVKAKEGLRISEEVNRVAMERGFIGGSSVECPMTGRGPRGWVGEVLEGIEEGRLVEGDFLAGHPFQN